MHTSIRKQTNRCAVVKLYQQIYIALGALFTTSKGAKGLNLHDGLCLEVVNDLLGYRLIAHLSFWSLFVCKYRY